MLNVMKNQDNVNIAILETIIPEVSKVIFGKNHELKLALACILARGHLLIEDVPGVGKTTFVMSLAKVLGLEMNRIQFTNDLLPADVLGSNLFDQKTGTFKFHKGPIFAEVVLGDELNRASPKSQSAFLQAMEERMVSIDGTTYQLPDPFFIFATQNPQSQVGTNPLPESQLDRFLFCLSLGYPSQESERALLLGGNPREKIKEMPSLLNGAAIKSLQSQTDKIAASIHLIKYVQNILAEGRSRNLNLSPRAGLQWIQAAKAWALLEKRSMVLPEDIKTLAVPVLVHRIANQDKNTIDQLIRDVNVP